MPDLNAKLAHLEARREGAAKECPLPLRFHLAPTPDPKTPKVLIGLRCIDDAQGLVVGGIEGGTPDDTAQFIVDLVNASPWLIPLARQAEKLAEGLSDMVTGKELTRHMFLSAEEEDDAWEYFHDAEKNANEVLAEFEAIKKEAENAP